MAVGDYPAGSDPAGDDPVAAQTAARSVTYPAAALFDIGSKDAQLDTAGLYVGIHPVDAWVALQLSVRLGTMKSAPTVGHRLDELRRGSLATLTRQAQDFVALALADGIGRGDVRLVAVTLSQPPPTGRNYVTVTYQNLRTLASKPITTTVQV